MKVRQVCTDHLVQREVLRHGQAAFRLVGGGAGAGDVRGTQFDGSREQARTLPHVNIPVKVDLGHGLSPVWPPLRM
ncbi:hypothetical protein ACH4CC_04390 [Streptomyces lydicus]|uniref:hypothetical protein n=1 Tax=Streptomyces lydicus TaxID=47763 RepID=UPI0037B9ED58